MVGVMTDKEILEYIKVGKLIAVNFNEKNLTPNGYDLSAKLMNFTELDPTLKVYKIMTDEYLKIPEDIVGRMYLKSRYCRKGVWGSFGFIDAGFEGAIEFTLFNFPKEEFEGKTDSIPLVQVIFEKLGKNVEKSYAKRSGNFQFTGLEI
jgi:dCTP deaminase